MTPAEILKLKPGDWVAVRGQVERVDENDKAVELLFPPRLPASSVGLLWFQPSEILHALPTPKSEVKP